MNTIVAQAGIEANGKRKWKLERAENEKGGENEEGRTEFD